jgi:hypothetical protein
VLTEEIRRARRGALGISGIRVRALCSAEGLRVDLVRPSGAPIAAQEPLVVVTTDMLASGAVFSSVAPPGGFTLSYAAPVVREVVADWVQQRGGHLSEGQFVDLDNRRWQLPDASAECLVP